MKILRWLLKILLLPVRIILSIIVAFLSFLLGIASIILGILSFFCVVGAIASFVQGEIQLGIIGLVFGFICSPYGLQTIATYLIAAIEVVNRLIGEI